MRLSRKEFLLGATASACGCATLPSVESVELAAKGVGGSVGLLLNECRLPDAVRTVLAAIVSTVVLLTPGAGETLIGLWTAAAKSHLAALVAAGALTAMNAAVVLAAFVLVLAGLALLEKRYPQLATVKNIMSAAINGFGTGFLATFKPSGLAVPSVDVEAYETLKADPALVSLQALTEALDDSNASP